MASRKVTLRSKDNRTFEVDLEVARQSEFLKPLCEDGCPENAIPIPEITGNILAMVIEYCKKHVEALPASDDEDAALKQWDANFVEVDSTTLNNLVHAANFLEIPGLLDLTCQAVTNVLRDCTAEDIRSSYQSFRR